MQRFFTKTFSKKEDASFNQAVAILKEAKLSSHKNLKLLSENKYRLELVIKDLQILQKEQILTQDSFLFLMHAPAYPGKLATQLTTLKKAGLASPGNFALLAKHSHYSHCIAAGIYYLHDITQIDFLLLIKYIITQEDANLFYAGENIAKNFTTQLNQLKIAGLATPEIYMVLSQEAKYAEHLAKGFIELNAANLYTKPNCNFLVLHAPHASGISNLLAELNNTKLATQENYDRIQVCVEYSDGIAETLCVLTNIGHATKKNYEQLVRYASLAADIGVNAVGKKRSCYSS